MPVQGVSYTPVGGVTGQQAQQKTADVRDRYNELVQREALTKGLSI
jgi:hypothetical protein